MILKLVYWLINYGTGHATARLYTSRVPVGQRLGGHDVKELSDFFVIVDFRVNEKIVLLGYFQSC